MHHGSPSGASGLALGAVLSARGWHEAGHWLAQALLIDLTYMEHGMVAIVKSTSEVEARWLC